MPAVKNLCLRWTTTCVLSVALCLACLPTTLVSPAYAAGESGTVSISTATVKLSKSSYTYTGKARKPSVTVKSADGTKLVKGTDYTVSYASGRKAIGSYKVTVKGKGSYKGKVTKSFTIKPAKVSLSSAKSGSAGKLTVKWAKAAGGVKYQVAYKKSGSSSWSYATVSGTSKTLKGLARNKKYKVKVRAYKKVDGTKYCGAWSSAKTVKVKKGSSSSSSSASSSSSSSSTVYITASGTKYHTSKSCRGLNNANSVTKTTLSKAKAAGYTACAYCG